MRTTGSWDGIRRDSRRCSPTTSEMARVVRDGGALGACVWDHAGEGGPLTVFWRAAHEIDPDVNDESQRMGAREGQLAELFAKAGLHTVTETSLVATATHATFDEWW